MVKLLVSEARKNFSDAINRVAYAKERIVLTRRGTNIVALVPAEDLAVIEAVEDRMDLADARAALAAAKRKGERPVPWEKDRRKLGL